MGNWLVTFEGLVAAAIPAAGFVYTYTVNRRSQYDRVLALTAQVSTSPIAKDRHVAGTAFEPTSVRDPAKPVTLHEREIKAVYNVLWYFERVDAVYVSLRPLIRSKRITRVQALLLDTLATAMTVWMTYASEAAPCLRHLADEYARLQEQRSRRGRYRCDSNELPAGYFQRIVGAVSLRVRKQDRAMARPWEDA